MGCRKPVTLPKVDLPTSARLPPQIQFPAFDHSLRPRFGVLHLLLFLLKAQARRTQAGLHRLRPSLSCADAQIDRLILALTGILRVRLIPADSEHARQFSQREVASAVQPFGQGDEAGRASRGRILWLFFG